MPTLTAATIARTARLALVVVATLLALAATTQTASATGWRLYDVDSDSLWDAKGIDADNNGNLEDVIYDLDNDGYWDTRVFNTRGSDSLLEVANYDMDENGRLEFQLRDGDQRVGFDYILTDRDQNGYFDRIGGYTMRIIPGSNVDYTTRINRQNASRDLIYRFRSQTGNSLLYPSFPSCC